jgi:hypothetical protein
VAHPRTLYFKIIDTAAAVVKLDELELRSHQRWPDKVSSIVLASMGWVLQNGRTNLHCSGSGIDCHARIRADAAYATICLCYLPDDALCLSNRGFESLLCQFLI